MRFTRAFATLHRSAYVSLLLLYPVFAFGQELRIPPVRYPQLSPHANSAEAFIPTGWRLEAKYEGDLNNDKRPDIVFVLRDNDKRNILKRSSGDPYDSNPRILAIAFSAPGGGFDLTVQNHTLIPRADDPDFDDYFDTKGGIQIKNGALHIDLISFANMGTWWTSQAHFTFRFQDGHFALIGYDSSDFNRTSHESEELSVNYLTSLQKRTTGSDQGGPDKVVSSRISKRALLTLDQIGDGLAFNSTKK